jgi:hypothetical protein
LQLSQFEHDLVGKPMPTRGTQSESLPLRIMRPA